MTFKDRMRLELETAAALADIPDFAKGVEAILAKHPLVWRRN